MVVNTEGKIKELEQIQGLDIGEHFGLIHKYGSQCNHITEFGVRSIVSTWGWLNARPKKFVCYDLVHPNEVGGRIEDVYDTAESLGIDFSFCLGDTREVEIEETDLLFIDTNHTYSHMKVELEVSGNKARKFLVFHDTAWAHDMCKAIDEFRQLNPHWVIEEQVTNNNGFTILKRI